MSHGSLSRSLPVLALLGVLAGLALAHAAEAIRVYLMGPVALEVTQAFHGAVRKLEDPACRELFTDFTDSEGRTLMNRHFVWPPRLGGLVGGGLRRVCGPDTESTDPER
jgi:hypothetical protein